jgi:ribokinase
MLDVCVVGSFMADMVIRAPRRPNRGETIQGTSLTTYLGGKGFNQAIAAARSGASTAMVGAVGDDEQGLLFKGALACEGIDASAVVTVPDVGTGVAVPLVEDAGDNSIVIIPQANHALTPAHMESFAEVIGGAKVVLLQLELPIETVAAAAALARRSGATVVLNPAPAVTSLAPFRRLVDILVPNETETELLTGAPVANGSAAAAAERLCRSLDAPNAVVTLGEHGALVYNASGSEWHPGHAVDTVDTVGAGDAFCGALCAALASGADLFEAARIGNAAGALAVTKAGAEPSMPHKRDIDALLRDRPRPFLEH